MGTFFNPGNGRFRESLNSKIYVDKTELIKYTNDVLSSEQKYICVSRPRRFGKSMAAKMLAAYYGRDCDSHALFDGLKITQDRSYEKNINRYNVISVDISGYLDSFKSETPVQDILDKLFSNIVSEIEKEYPDILQGDDILSVYLDRVYKETGIPFVFIIDEWDVILRDRRDDSDGQEGYLKRLKALFKDKEYVALAYMTGILPVRKYGESSVNMFREISMTDAGPLAQYTGFTEDEVMSLCEKYNRSYSEMKEWYDGYDVNGMAIYNPRAVVESIENGHAGNYWTQTGSYESLKVYINMNAFGVRDRIARLIAGEEIKVKTDKFQSSMVSFESADDVLTLLIHLGYLTYDREKGTVRIPNKEVRDRFTETIEDLGWGDVVSSLNNSEELLKATWAGDEKKVAQFLDTAHTENSSVLKYNDENSLACVITLAYYTARKDYTVIREMPAGNGFADIVYLPKKGAATPCMVIELKCDEAADTAIDKIKERRYTESLKDYGGDILLVGISYGKTSKKHSCRIEKISK